MVEKYGILHLPDGWIYKQAGKRKLLIQGHGKNDVEFSTCPNIDGKRYKHVAYQIWQDMLRRCFSEAYLSTHTSYIGTKCSDDWKLFSKFLIWFNKNYISGYQLDKDLLYRGNKLYSENTCIFIPPQVNTYIITSTKARGILPVGVHSKDNKFQSTIQIDGKTTHLGIFTDPILAHRAWQKAKIEHAKELMEKYNIAQLQLVIDRLQNDMNNNIITEVI